LIQHILNVTIEKLETYKNELSGLKLEEKFEDEQQEGNNDMEVEEGGEVMIEEEEDNGLDIE